jgi:hypothetical protein
VQEGERGEGNKREGESCWKSGGGRTRLYTWPRVGLAGGEGGHGAANPNGVIHRYVLTIRQLHVEPGHRGHPGRVQMQWGSWPDSAVCLEIKATSLSDGDFQILLKG